MTWIFGANSVRDFWIFGLAPDVGQRNMMRPAQLRMTTGGIIYVEITTNETQAEVIGVGLRANSGSCQQMRNHFIFQASAHGCRVVGVFYQFGTQSQRLWWEYKLSPVFKIVGKPSEPFARVAALGEVVNVRPQINRRTQLCDAAHFHHQRFFAQGNRGRVDGNLSITRFQTQADAVDAVRDPQIQRPSRCKFYHQTAVLKTRLASSFRSGTTAPNASVLTPSKP